MSGCVLCGESSFTRLFAASDRLYRTTARQFEIIRCGACGLIRLDPPPSREDLRHYYPENYWFAPDRTAASRWEEAYRRLVLRDHVAFVARSLGGSRVRGPLLDIGCGGGLFLGMMRQRGFRVIGLDFSPEAAAIAWRRQQVPAICAMFENSPLRPRSFAGVTMFHVLEHLYDPRVYLIAAHQALQPNGRLVVQVPNASCWQFRLLGRRWTGVDVPRHLFDFRDTDVERLVESCGFEVVRRKYFSWRDNPAGLASSLAPALDPMARRVRRLPETGGTRLAKDLTYLALVAAAVPFTLAEAACQAGSTIMIEARKR
jgi:SAM-dependent methyltransferase